MSAERVAAHLILGAREEPFLAALLESLSGAVDSLIVNDNGSDPSPHDATLRESWFGDHDRLFVDRAPFVDFSTARNRCLDVHARTGAGTWIAFVDADEVHGETVRCITRNLGEVPAAYDFVDGYTWHFFQSFDLYTSIERRMAFFRFNPGARWVGNVHEQLVGLNGKRLALPYVYAHYGHVLPARRHAEKGRHYSSLGQRGETVPEEALDSLDPAVYFKRIWPDVLRFTGEHPPAAQSAIARLRAEYAADQARALELARAAQPPLVRARNVLLKANYELRWRSRELNALSRKLVST
ncbi:MAG TPA: hypothetical protein VFO29_07385 [Candidatus Rubrimentiphilum sp.]|nr:hypothetical protein [Candidatus Rubrimentiphilum sp.]